MTSDDGAAAAAELEQRLDRPVGPSRDDDDLARPGDRRGRRAQGAVDPGAVDRLDRRERIERQLPVVPCRADPHILGLRRRPDEDDPPVPQHVGQREGPAARTAASKLDCPIGPATPSGSWSRTIARSSRGASSSSFTISRPRRAVLGQCTARSGSPGA